MCIRDSPLRCSKCGNEISDYIEIDEWIEERHLIRINKILDSDKNIQDSSQLTFNLSCKTSGKGIIWEAEYKVNGMTGSKNIKTTNAYFEREEDPLSFVLDGILGELKLNN